MVSTETDNLYPSFLSIWLPPQLAFQFRLGSVPTQELPGFGDLVFLHMRCYDHSIKYLHYQINKINFIIIHSKYFPVSDWLKPHE